MLPVILSEDAAHQWKCREQWPVPACVVLSGNDSAIDSLQNAHAWLHSLIQPCMNRLSAASQCLLKHTTPVHTTDTTCWNAHRLCIYISGHCTAHLPSLRHIVQCFQLSQLLLPTLHRWYECFSVTCYAITYTSRSRRQDNYVDTRHLVPHIVKIVESQHKSWSFDYAIWSRFNLDFDVRNTIR